MFPNHQYSIDDPRAWSLRVPSVAGGRGFAPTTCPVTGEPIDVRATTIQPFANALQTSITGFRDRGPKELVDVYDALAVAPDGPTTLGVTHRDVHERSSSCRTCNGPLDYGTWHAQATAAGHDAVSPCRRCLRQTYAALADAIERVSGLSPVEHPPAVVHVPNDEEIAVTAWRERRNESYGKLRNLLVIREGDNAPAPESLLGLLRDVCAPRPTGNRRRDLLTRVFGVADDELDELLARIRTKCLTIPDTTADGQYTTEISPGATAGESIDDGQVTR